MFTLFTCVNELMSRDIYQLMKNKGHMAPSIIQCGGSYNCMDEQVFTLFTLVNELISRDIYQPMRNRGHMAP